MKQYTIQEIVFLVILSVAIGILWILFGPVYALLAPALNTIGLSSLLNGVYVIASVIFPYVIRKPGVAILGEVIAACVEMFLSQWGLTSLVYALVQGGIAEILFLATGYKKFSLNMLMLVGGISSLSSELLSIFIYHYYSLSLTYNIIKMIGGFVSGVIIAGFLIKLIFDKLLKAGLLNQFNISKN